MAFIYVLYPGFGLKSCQQVRMCYKRKDVNSHDASKLDVMLHNEDKPNVYEYSHLDERDSKFKCVPLTDKESVCCCFALSKERKRSSDFISSTHDHD